MIRPRTEQGERLVGGVRLAAWASLAMGMLLTVGQSSGRQPATTRAAGADVPLSAGTWHGVANGDRVLALLREGAVVWSATEGGVVQWDATGGRFRQYLAPQDGLPDNRVRALARDRGGVLWAGTARGLAWLDRGADRWVAVATDHPDLPSPSVTALAVDPDGALWAGFEAQWDADRLPEPDADPGAFVGGGLGRFDPATRVWGPAFRAAPEDGAADRFAPLPSDNVTALRFDHAGRLWVGTRPFFVWSRTGHADPGQGGGWSWVNTGGGLAVLEPGDRTADDPWTQWQAGANPCIPGTVNSLAVDARDRVWVGSTFGLHAFMRGPDTQVCGGGDGGGHAQYRRRSGGGMISNNVLAVAVDARDRIWMGLAEGSSKGQGLLTLDHNGTPGDEPRSAAALDDTWTTLAPDGPAAADEMFPAALLVADDGVWVGMRGRFAGDGWGVLARDKGGDSFRTLATASAGLPSNRVTFVARHPDSGDVWFGTDGRGVARWDGQAWQVFRFNVAGGGLPGDHVTSIAFGADGRVWVGARAHTFADGVFIDGGLGVFDGRDWRVFRSPPAVPNISNVQSLAVDPAGRVWIGTDGAGAAIFNPASGGFSQFPPNPPGDGFGGRGVTGITVDPVTGHVWFAHEASADFDCEPPPSTTCTRVFRGGGVSRWDGAGLKHWSKAGGSPLSAFGNEGDMTSILYDRDRARLWAGAWDGRSGFHWPDGRNIDATLNGCDRPCADGAWGGERFVDAGAVRALATDAAGRLWVGMHRNGNGIIPPPAGVRILSGDADWRSLTADTGGLPDDEVTALGAAGDGMWVGTLDRGAALWRPLDIRSRVYLPATANERVR